MISLPPSGYDVIQLEISPRKSTGQETSANQVGKLVISCGG